MNGVGEGGPFADGGADGVAFFWGRGGEGEGAGEVGQGVGEEGGVF